MANQIAFPAFAGIEAPTNDTMRQFIQALELRLQSMEGDILRALPDADDEAMSASMQSLADDSSPHLGGDLDVDGYNFAYENEVTGRFTDPVTLGLGETSFWLFDFDTGMLNQVQVGEPDSGGSGYRMLRISN